MRQDVIHKRRTRMLRILSSKSVVAVAAVADVLATMAQPTLARRPAQQAHADSGVLVYPDVVAELWPRTLDAPWGLDTSSYQVVYLVYSGLVKLNSNNQVVPDLASAMPRISADRLTYTFTLRSNAAFSDGTPVTAQYVVDSISRALSSQEASPVAMTFLGH